MSHVRNIIELLTKVLRSNGTAKIKAEIFRLAKFNKDEAVGPLWRLLFELIYFLEYGVLDEVVSEALTALTAEEQVVYVKRYVQLRGYSSRDFAGLPHNMSTGSRELLLALAWLLAEENIVDRFMLQCCTPLHDAALHTHTPQDESHSAWTMQASLATVQKVQQMQLLNGKLRLNLKNLYALHRERAKLQHKVHESTYGAGGQTEREHLTVLEVQLLRHPDYLKRMISLLEKDSVRLQQLLAWKAQEEVFWTWMESVVDLKRQELSQAGQDYPTPVLHYNIPPDLLGTLSRKRKLLEAAILKFEPIIEQLEELWEYKHDSISKSDLDNLLAAIELELCIHEANLASNPKQPLQYRDPEFVYVKSCNKKSSSTRHPERLSVNQGDMVTAPAAEDLHSEMVRLQSHIARLELETTRKQELYHGQLDSLATQIPGAVCIQPASLS